MLKLRKAYLHIGVEKTGTTTIQSFMAANRITLREQGFLYPVAPGSENHVGLTMLAAPNSKTVEGLHGFVRLRPGDDLKRYSSEMLSELEREISESGCHALIFSNEHLSSRIRAAESILLLKNALTDMVENVEVIVYLRRQDEALLSEYSTLVKGGSTEPFALRPYRLKKYNYADLLDRWSGVFGNDRIAVRLFERRSFHGGDLIADFLRTINCSDSASFSRVLPQNTSLDAACLEYLRRLNKHLPGLIDGGPNKERGGVAKHLAALSMGEPPRISGEQAAEILSHFEKSNRDVAVRYLKKQNEQLFETSPELSIKSNLGELDDDMVFKISADLWRGSRGFGFPRA